MRHDIVFRMAYNQICLCDLILCICVQLSRPETMSYGKIGKLQKPIVYSSTQINGYLLSQASWKQPRRWSLCQRIPALAKFSKC